MRVIHKGYAAMTYGKSHLTVSDRDGKIVYETDQRNEALCSENGLRELIEVLIKDGKRGTD